MEERREIPPTPSAEQEHPAQESPHANAEGHTETETERFEKDRAEVLSGERARLAQDYTVLRDTLLDLREKSESDPSASEDYERVRNQYLRQIVELYSRSDVRRTREINDEGMRAMVAGHRGEKGVATTTFELGLDSVVRRATGNTDFNGRFDMLIEHRPEGEEALPFLEKLIPDMYAQAMKSERQLKTQLAPEANVPADKAAGKETLHAAFDDIKDMLETERKRKVPRRPRMERPHEIRKPGLVGRLTEKIFGKKKAS